MIIAVKGNSTLLKLTLTLLHEFFFLGMFTVTEMLLPGLYFEVNGLAAFSLLLFPNSKRRIKTIHR
jgi:hypothetical protein